uniref:Protein unc-93 homolog B1 n=1 Tax=Macaca fascicularis TaxID=9541 RepID=A0A7N9CNA2_MACFA
MEAEPPLYPMAGAAGPQGDEDRLGVPDGPEAPVSGDQEREGQGSPVVRGGPGVAGTGGMGSGRDRGCERHAWPAAGRAGGRVPQLQRGGGGAPLLPPQAPGRAQERAGGQRRGHAHLRRLPGPPADAADPALRRDLPRGEIWQHGTARHRQQDADGHQRDAHRRPALHTSAHQVFRNQVDDVPGCGHLRPLCLHQLLGALLHACALCCGPGHGHRASLGFHGQLHHQLSFACAQLPMIYFLNHYLYDLNHTLYNVQSCGTNSHGILSGFNKTVLRTLPRSGNLIVVESVLMAVAFLAMLLVLGLCGAAYRPTEEIDLRSVGWGNIFQLPFKHVRDYRLRHLVPFFIYSGFEVLFACTGIALGYGVCSVGLERLAYLLVAYSLGASAASLLGLLGLWLPRPVPLVAGAGVHLLLTFVLFFWAPVPRVLQHSWILYVAAALWGVGSALNKTGLSTLLGILYEDKERQDFIFTIYHWWQAVAIFTVYLGSSLPMKAKLAVLLVTLVAAAVSYLRMEQKLRRGVAPRQPASRGPSTRCAVTAIWRRTTRTRATRRASMGTARRRRRRPRGPGPAPSPPDLAAGPAPTNRRKGATGPRSSEGSPGPGTQPPCSPASVYHVSGRGDPLRVPSCLQRLLSLLPHIGDAPPRARVTSGLQQPPPRRGGALGTPQPRTGVRKHS